MKPATAVSPTLASGTQIIPESLPLIPHHLQPWLSIDLTCVRHLFTPERYLGGPFVERCGIRNHATDDL